MRTLLSFTLPRYRLLQRCKCYQSERHCKKSKWLNGSNCKHNQSAYMHTFKQHYCLKNKFQHFKHLVNQFNKTLFGQGCSRTNLWIMILGPALTRFTCLQDIQSNTLIVSTHSMLFVNESQTTVCSADVWERWKPVNQISKHEQKVF